MSSRYTRLTAPTPLAIPASFSNNGTKLAQGAKAPVYVVLDATLPNQTEQQIRIPPTEQWLFYQVYTPTAPSADAFISIKINGVDQNVTWGPLSQTLPTQYHVISQNAKILAKPNDIVQFFAILANTAMNTTAVVSQSFYINAMRIPSGYRGRVYI
ncbi:MAG: hypothetical protein QW478_04175 [Candidatus Micrarchaeaceae archaeon]